MILLDGKATARAIEQEMAAAVAQHPDRPPHLAVVLVGNHAASETYVRNKVRTCERVGFRATLRRFEADLSERALLSEIDRLNRDETIDGFIVQSPLPDHISVDKVVDAIDPAKDVDGFHPVNIGRMVRGWPAYLPATPYGILLLLERYGVETSGKHCVVLGRSHIVGSPMSILLTRNAQPGNCTVTTCHSRTQNLTEHLRRADIVVAALGIPEFVKADMVKPGATVVDVGISRVADSTKKSGYALKGDVAFDEVAEKCGYITPVPGGVGPMTIAALLTNTLKAARREVYPASR